MTLDPELVRAAIASKDARGVRDLLRDATEADRRACAKSLRPLLRDDQALLEQLFPDNPRMVPLTAENRPDDMPDFMMEVLSGFSGGGAAFLIEDFRATPEGREHEETVRLRQSTAFTAAALGLAGGVAEAARIAQEGGSFEAIPEAGLDAVAGVLADRRPPWLAEFIDRHLIMQARFRGLGFPAWPLARRLVRLGAIARPAVAEYTTLMPSALCPMVFVDGDWQQPVTPGQALLADQGLLEDEVWRLFAVPDAAWEVQRTGGWAPALVTLAQQGHLDRDRLLDSCLGAFLRDFAPSRVEWYAQLHDHLEPSLAEMSARGGTYLALLGSGSSFAVKLAQRVTGLLLAEGLLDAPAFLAASVPTLLFPRKNVVTAQLRLIDRVIRAHPEAAAAALVTVAQAFGHERADIQEAALKLITRHGLPGGQERAEIGRLASALAPSLTAQAARLGVLPADSAATVPAAVAGARDETAAAARLTSLADRISVLPDRRAAPLRAALAQARSGEVPGPAVAGAGRGEPLPAPVTDPAELVALFTRLLEDASGPLDLERALAGAVRLCHLPQTQRRELAAPLLKRATALTEHDYGGPFGGTDLSTDVAYVVLAWGTGWAYQGKHHSYSHWQPREAVYAAEDPRIMPRIPAARAREVTAIVNRGQPVPLLAEPECDRGTISHQQFTSRLAGWYAASQGQPPSRYDLEVALLRLAPGAGEPLWEEWARLDLATATRARRCHEAAQQPISLCPVLGSPRSQHHAEPPRHVHVLARTDGDPAASESDAWRLLTALSDPLADYFLVYGERWELRSGYDAFVAGWPLLAPWQPELIAAHLLRPLSDGLKPGRTPAATAVACLAHPGHALGPIGHLALLAGLASAEADTRIAAARAWAQACLDGRLDARLAAAALAAGVTGKAFKLNRITDGLRHATSLPIAAYRVVEAVCLCVPDLLETRDPNLHLLVSLAADLAATAGLPDLPPDLASLARRGRSRLSAAAALLAGAASVPAPDRPEAAAQALAALVTRAEAGETRS